MFKRILLSLGVITVVAGAAVVGTQALLSDSVTLTANTFSTGSVDLEISTDNVTFADTSVGFSETDLMPGDKASAFFWLQNLSDVDMTLTGQANINHSTSEIDPTLVEVSLTPVDGGGSPITGAVTTTFTIQEWEDAIRTLGNDLDASTTQRYMMEVTIDESVTTENGSIDFDFTFTGTQVATP
jgi:hypothetical protein